MFNFNQQCCNFFPKPGEYDNLSAADHFFEYDSFV